VADSEGPFSVDLKVIVVDLLNDVYSMWKNQLMKLFLE